MFYQSVCGGTQWTLILMTDAVKFTSMLHIVARQCVISNNSLMSVCMCVILTKQLKNYSYEGVRGKCSRIVMAADV